MDRIAFIIGARFLYWSPMLLSLAAVGAVLLFLGLYLGKSENGNAAALAVPLSVGFSLVLSRLVHWYCRPDSYASMLAALTDYSTGGYALMGVFAGCALAALVLRLTRVSRNLPEMLDAMSIAGAAGIAVGRLASFFDTSARGMLVASARALPWVYPVTNAVSGQEEYRLATFVFQAAVTGVLFLGLLLFWISSRKRGTCRDGDVTLIFLLCHGAAQVLMDSTRYDSLFFRSNGFVSIVQVLGALGIGLAAILFSVRLVRQQGFKVWYIGLWVVFAALMGIGGYMEYHVQRHAAEAVFAYSVMGTALVAIIAWVLMIRFLACRAPRETAV